MAQTQLTVLRPSEALHTNKRAHAKDVGILLIASCVLKFPTFQYETLRECINSIS